MVWIEDVKRNNKLIGIVNKKNKIYFYVGTFFFLAASVSVAILIGMYFLMKINTFY